MALLSKWTSLTIGSVPLSTPTGPPTSMATSVAAPSTTPLYLLTTTTMNAHVSNFHPSWCATKPGDVIRNRNWCTHDTVTLFRDEACNDAYGWKLDMVNDYCFDLTTFGSWIAQCDSWFWLGLRAMQIKMVLPRRSELGLIMALELQRKRLSRIFYQPVQCVRGIHPWSEELA
jgi:hypothetical protein